MDSITKNKNIHTMPGSNIKKPRKVWIVVIFIVILVVIGVFAFVFFKEKSGSLSNSEKDIRKECYENIIFERTRLMNSTLDNLMQNLQELARRNDELGDKGFIDCQKKGGIADDEIIGSIEDYQLGEGNIFTCATEECNKSLAEARALKNCTTEECRNAIEKIP